MICKNCFEQYDQATSGAALDYPDLCWRCALAIEEDDMKGGSRPGAGKPQSRIIERKGAVVAIKTTPPEGERVNIRVEDGDSITTQQTGRVVISGRLIRLEMGDGRIITVEL